MYLKRVAIYDGAAHVQRILVYMRNDFAVKHTQPMNMTMPRKFSERATKCKHLIFK